MPPIEDAVQEEALSMDAKLVAAAEQAFDETAKNEADEAPPEKVVAEVKSEPRDDGRDDKGRFARSGEKPLDDKSAELGKSKPDALTPTPQQAAPQPQTQDQAQQPDRPPPGWSPQSKHEWDKLPPHIRADIAKREQEVSQGFKEYEGLKPFAARAKQGGQTLNEALSAYVGIEDLMRSDPGAGFMHIAQNLGQLGFTQAQAGQLFANLAQRLGATLPTAPGYQAPGGSATDSNGAADPAALQNLLRPVLEPVMQRFSKLEGVVSNQLTADQKAKESMAGGVVEQFRSDPAHRYYDNLENDIARLLENGMVARTGNMQADLKAAYELACYAKPEVRELIIKDQHADMDKQKQQQALDAAKKARSASRSVHGTPAAGAREPKRSGQGDSLRAIAEQAYDSAAV